MLLMLLLLAMMSFKSKIRFWPHELHEMQLSRETAFKRCSKADWYGTTAALTASCYVWYTSLFPVSVGFTTTTHPSSTNIPDVILSFIL